MKDPMLTVKHYLFTPILWLLSRLPISYLRGVGALIGLIGLKIGGKSLNRLRSNLLRTGIATDANVDSLVRSSSVESGKTLIEMASIAWFRSKGYNDSLIKNWDGFDVVLEQERLNCPIVFLTPHIGNFEIAVKAVANRLNKNLTILYKPPKDQWFHHLMLTGRTEDNIKPVPTNSRGVISLIKALKGGEHIGVLPDSVASKGDGVWVNFFGNKVFATTLSAKMVLLDNVATFVVGCYRVANGFNLEFIPYIKKNDEVKTIVQDIYGIIERIVLKSPTQYFWSYDRFRVPDHAANI